MQRLHLGVKFGDFLSWGKEYVTKQLDEIKAFEMVTKWALQSYMNHATLWYDSKYFFLCVSFYMLPWHSVRLHLDIIKLALDEMSIVSQLCQVHSGGSNP